MKTALPCNECRPKYGALQDFIARLEEAPLLGKLSSLFAHLVSLQEREGEERTRFSMSSNEINSLKSFIG